MAQNGIAELDLGGAGSSSTMPQKQNPVAPSVLVALARHTAGQTAILHGAEMHRHQRDGAAWFTEWMCLPKIVLGVVAELDVMGDSLCESGRSKRPALNVRHDHPAAPWAFSGYSRDDMSQVKGRTLS